MVYHSQCGLKKPMCCGCVFMYVTLLPHISRIFHRFNTDLKYSKYMSQIGTFIAEY